MEVLLPEELLKLRLMLPLSIKHLIHLVAKERHEMNICMPLRELRMCIYVMVMHQMMNIVTNDKNIPDAVLIRAVEPIAGIEHYAEKNGQKNAG